MLDFDRPGTYNIFCKQRRPLLTCPQRARHGNKNPKTDFLCGYSFGLYPHLICRWRCPVIAQQDLMINEEIRDPEVRLIDENGNQLGVFDVREAQSLADERGLDLVKINPNSNPPVCKLMDYSKYQFDMRKREKEQRKNQKTIEVKETRLSATIDVHDMEVKAKATKKFLEDGNKVKVSIRFRGRQITHGDIGEDVMEQFFQMVSDVAVKERAAKQEGRNMFMVLAPKN